MIPIDSLAATEHPADDLFADLFDDLVEKFGESSGGTEEFLAISETRIGCRYADAVIHRRDGGWSYGHLPDAYPTPADCYAHWRADDARMHAQTLNE